MSFRIYVIFSQLSRHSVLCSFRPVNWHSRSPRSRRSSAPRRTSSTSASMAVHRKGRRSATSNVVSFSPVIFCETTHWSAVVIFVAVSFCSFVHFPMSCVAVRRVGDLHRHARSSDRPAGGAQDKPPTLYISSPRWSRPHVGHGLRTSDQEDRRTDSS